VKEMTKAAKTTSDITSPITEWSRDSIIILYEVVSLINSAENQQELFNHFLKHLTNRLKAKAASLRLITDDVWMDLTCQYNIGDTESSQIQHTAIESALFSRSSEPIELIKISPASNLLSNSSDQMLTIPVRHLVHTLGAINIIYEPGAIELDNELASLLFSAAHHLALAIEKYRLENLARQQLAQRERSMIANELHDSLAQTLASLRFQVRILDQSLQPSGDYMAINSIEQVEHGLDEAYTDLRELIAHCRVPVEQQGLTASIKRVVEKFREETGIHILLQCERTLPDIPANMEMNVYRIVQESLTNIRKHAKAKIVRVLLDCDAEGRYRVLIENDGIGFDKKAIQSSAGNHLGLTIMQERARHLGGKLRIESEPEEGTRIELKFQYQSNQAG
jgi:two-component system nitrate/nitrite sensor histidine kinase NarX